MQQEREQRHKMKKMRNQPPDPGILTPPVEDPSRVSKFDPMPADFNIAGNGSNNMYLCSCMYNVSLPLIIFLMHFVLLIHRYETWTI